jgi:hypothetical protein
MRSDTTIEEQDNECPEEFMQDMVGQMTRGFIEATLYVSIGSAVLSHTQHMDYNVAEAALDGIIGGALLGVAMACISNGLDTLRDLVCQTRPCPPTSVFMASPIQQVKTFSKWLAQSVIFAGGAGLGNAITQSAASPREAIIAGEAGLGIAVTGVVSSIAIIASAAGAVRYIERRFCAPARGDNTSLDDDLSRSEQGNTHLLHKKDQEEPLAEKNHVMTIMPH